MSLAEVENMAALQSFTLGGSGGMFPRKRIILTSSLFSGEEHSDLRFNPSTGLAFFHVLVWLLSSSLFPLFISHLGV